MFQGFYETGLGGKPGIGFDIGDFPSVVGSESLDQSEKGLKSGMSISAFRRWRYNPEDLIDARFANCALRYIVSSMRSEGFLDKQSDIVCQWEETAHRLIALCHFQQHIPFVFCVGWPCDGEAHQLL